MNKLKTLLKKYNIEESEFIPYGIDKAKLDNNILKRLSNNKDGKLILVTAINPTKAGEGKTTVSIGLADGLNKLDKNTIIALREPSLGPFFGVKGGATGGGESILEPELDINLHFNGDFHAITSAHNLLSALIDSHIHFKNKLKFKEVLWPRALDVNDRSLRNISTKQGNSKFVITAASELMAVMALSKDLTDLKTRINNILIGTSNDEEFIYVRDLKCADSLVLLLKDAINTNVVKTKEGSLALVHCGPFANIAHGCNSIIATNTALKLADYVVTEAGFGSELGFEKFIDIKMKHLSKDVDLVVLVVTVNSLKAHGNARDYNEPNLDALKEGLKNLEAHIDIIKSYNLNLVIALNRYLYNVNSELEFVVNWARNKNVDIEIADGYNNGASGMIDLSNKVLEVIKRDENIIKEITKPYNLNDDPKDKVIKIATKLYGAKNVRFSKNALKDIEKYKDIIRDLPVCIAKTPSSLSGNSKLINRPKDFTLYINEVKPQTGAGFFVAKTKGIYLMPGLSKNARAYDFDINNIT